MEPSLLPIKKARTFRSEAEYRLWQSELAAQVRPAERGEGLVSRIVNNVRGWTDQKEDTSHKPRVHGRTAKQQA